MHRHFSAVFLGAKRGPRYQVCGACLAAAFITWGFVVGIAGCGPKRPGVNLVEGIVTLDGVPVSNATLIFQPVSGGPSGAGMTDAGGRYVVTTLGHKPGAGVLAGDYTVTIRKYKSFEDELGPSPAEPDKLAQWQAKVEKLDAQWTAQGGQPLVTPKPYASDATSGLTAKVVPGRNTFDFALVGKPDAAAAAK